MIKTHYFLSFLLILLLAGCNSGENKKVEEKEESPQHLKIVMVIHGGTGTMVKGKMDPEREDAYTQKLTEALQKGYDAIQEGSSSVVAVQAAINVMEDSPLFNAGKGAVFTHEGKNELDAAIMRGQDLQAGAVAGVTTVKNPINAAKAVLEKSNHVMFAGKGAEIFAKKMNLEIVDTSYFYTERRWNSLQKKIAEEKEEVSISVVSDGQNGRYEDDEIDRKYGTVGAVALDKKGNIAAGTSTGGIVNKRHGRIGDSPIIGAGTYADNKTAGISCTGQGEYFIRSVAAKKVSDLIALKNFTIKEATESVVKEIKELGGTGGMIALNQKGEASVSFSTKGMFRGTVDEDGNIHIFIFSE